MTAVIKRELRAHLTRARGITFISLFFLAIGAISLYYNFLLGAPSTAYVSVELYIFALVLIPIISFSVISDEMQGGRYELLRSLPIGNARLIIGKFTALLCVIAIPMVLLFILPIILGSFGEVNYLTSYVSVICIFGFCAAYAAIGMLFSSLFKSRALSVVFTYVAGILMFAVENFVFDHLYLLLFGVFDVSAVLYHLSIVLIALYMTAFRFDRARRGIGEKDE